MLVAAFIIPLVYLFTLSGAPLVFSSRCGVVLDCFSIGFSVLD